MLLWPFLSSIPLARSKKKSLSLRRGLFLGVSLRLHSNLLYQKFVMNESPTTASLHSATPKKKKTPCISVLAGVKFLLKKGKDIFLWGSALQVFWQCGEASMRTRFCENYFLGERISQNRD